MERLRRWTALLCALAVTLSLAPAAFAAEVLYQPCTVGYNMDGEQRWLQISSGRPRHDLTITAVYDQNGRKIEGAERETIITPAPGAACEWKGDFTPGDEYEGSLVVNFAAAAVDGSSVVIRQGPATPMGGDLDSDIEYGEENGYNMLMYRHRVNERYEFCCFLYFDPANYVNGSYRQGGIGVSQSPQTPPQTPPAPQASEQSGTSSGVPGRSDRGNPLHAKGSGYELVRVDGEIMMDGTPGRTEERVISDTRKLLVDSYDANFKKTGSRQLDIELQEYGGVYYGEDYNFIVFGQDNWKEDNNLEVLRIVKYSKDWQRLGAASISNVFVSDVIGQHGNLSYAECNGMLYIHSGRSTYTLSDGQQHQANMTFCVRESDMTMTDGSFGADGRIGKYTAGNVSHSMQQDIMVDSYGDLVTLDCGDGYPRGAYLFRYPRKAGGERFTGSGFGAVLKAWPGKGDINVGASTCSLAETRDGYLSGYVDTGLGMSDGKAAANAYLTFTPRDNISNTASVTRPLTSLSASSQESAGFVFLIPTGMDGGYVLWYTMNREPDGYFSYTDLNMFYARYEADGSIGPAKKLDNVPAPYVGPICSGGKLIWGGDPEDQAGLRFCALDESGNARVYGASGQAGPSTGGTTPSSGETAPSTGGTPSFPDGTNPFTDVPEGSYYHHAVLWALKKGVTTGVTKTEFRPNAPCTRGQVVTFLWRAKGSPEPATTANPFRDVSPSSPFYKAILWAYENNITAGRTADRFDPGGACTNGHVLTFLWRANGKPAAGPYPGKLAGTYPASAYYSDAVAWADSMGLMSGMEPAFDPNQISPRANIVTYLYRDIAL